MVHWNDHCVRSALSLCICFGQHKGQLRCGGALAIHISRRFPDAHRAALFHQLTMERKNIPWGDLFAEAGIFDVYFADKGSVTQALLARVSYQLLDNACTAAEQHAAELTSFPDQMIFVIDHIIEALRADTLMLRFLERSFVWPGLDQIEASGEAEPLMRKVLKIVMCSPEMAGRTEREIYQRITALGSMCMSVCYTSVLEGKPDNIDNMKPILYDIIRRAL